MHCSKPRRITPALWCPFALVAPDILFLKHACSILRHSHPTLPGQVSVGQTAWRNHIQGWMTVGECCRQALEKVCLISTPKKTERAKFCEKWAEVQNPKNRQTARWVGESLRGARPRGRGGSSSTRASTAPSGMNCIKIGLPGKSIFSKRKGLLEVLFS